MTRYLWLFMLGAALGILGANIYLVTLKVHELNMAMENAGR